MLACLVNLLAGRPAPLAVPCPTEGRWREVLNTDAEEYGAPASATSAASRRCPSRRTAGPSAASRCSSRSRLAGASDYRGGVSADNSIVVEKLVREFRKGPRAVDGIDLQVAPGEIYGFLGPNGAGKSTTVLMLTTLLPPTSGSARVAGFDVVRQGPQVRRRSAQRCRRPRSTRSSRGVTTRLQTMLQGIPRPERRARADELLERVGLGFAADRKVGGTRGA